MLVSIHLLIGNSPSIKPLHVAVVLVGSGHTPTDGHEVNVQADGDAVENTVADSLDNLMTVAQGPVSQEAGCQNGEVQSRVVVVDICDTGHHDEWQVVQEPTNNRVQSSVVDMIDLGLAEFLEATLPSDEVPGDSKPNKSQ